MDLGRQRYLHGHLDLDLIVRIAPWERGRPKRRPRPIHLPNLQFMILILTDEQMDDHTQCVGQKLRERGADFRVFNPGLFPARAQLSMSYTSTGETRSR